MQQPAGAVFRPDIQALRAVAVLAVVVFHLRPLWLPGGYIGVDVFFVISGFLITAHLVREHERTGRIGLRRFYARRIRRLLPAALVVLGAALVATAVVIPASVREQTIREILSSLFYVQNWTLAANSVDYLRSTADPSLVQHFWTLSLEEQYYAFWPVALIAAAALALALGVRRRVAWGVALGLLFTGSLATSIVLTATSPAAAYFVTPTRLFQFAVGGFLALGATAITERLGSRGATRRGLAWAGLGAIVASTLLFDGSTAYPGVSALLPTMGAALVIAAAQRSDERWSPMVIGRARPVQFIGDISYSVYLWHWPLIVVYPLIVGHPPGVVGVLLIALVTVVVAALSRRFIELPFTAPQRRPRRSLVIIAAGMALVLLASGGQLAAIALDRQATADRIAAIEAGPCFGARAFSSAGECSLEPATSADSAFAATDYGDATIDDCGEGTRTASVGDAAECSFGDASSDDLVVLVGDSHAGHWLPALQVIAEQRGWHIVTLLRSSCPLTTSALTIDDVPQPACTEWRELASKRIDELAPDLVVVSSLTPFGYEFGGGDLGDDELIRQGYQESLSAIAGVGAAPVVVIHDTPYMEIDVPSCLGALQSGADSSSCDRDRVEVLDSHVDPLWDAAAAVDDVFRVDLSDSLCTDLSCLSVVGGVVVYRDRQHISATYSRSLAPALLAALTDAGVTVP